MVFTGNPEDVITIKNAAEEKLADYEIVYAQGCPILSEDVKIRRVCKLYRRKILTGRL